MIACAKCQRQNEDHYKFCLGCGSPLAAQAPATPPAAESIACPQCASRILAGQRFCGSCGFRVPDEEPTPTPAAVETSGDLPATNTAHGQQKAAVADVAAPVATEVGSTMPAPEASVEAPMQAEPVAAPVVEATPPVAEPAAAVVQNQAVVGRLIMVNPDGSPGDAYDLKEGDNVIGRSTDAAVFQRDEFLSPEHAVFRVRPDGIEIEDLQSLNGIYYRATGPVELFPGDVIRIGQEVLHFEALKDFPVDPALDKPGMGSPTGTVWGRVARISGPDNAASNAFLLWKDEHTVGRERGDFTFPDDGFVSGLHARIYREGGSVFVEDLKSSNGTYLKVKNSHVVQPGTLLLLGKQPFRVMAAG